MVLSIQSLLLIYSSNLSVGSVWQWCAGAIVCDILGGCVCNTDGLYVGCILGYLLGSIGGFEVGIFVALYFGACVVGDILGAWVRLMDTICVDLYANMMGMLMDYK